MKNKTRIDIKRLKKLPYDAVKAMEDGCVQEMILEQKFPELDSESFGGTDYPPLVTPEEEATILKFYAEHPELNRNYKPTAPSPIGLVFPMNGSMDFHEDEPWIQTYSGRRFNPTKPISEAIVIQDIAHSLSMQCRFNGHCKKFYSVANHSVLVSYLCDEMDALWGLLHDASEFALSDFPSPLKHSGKFHDYIAFENQMQEAICRRFMLPLKEPASVKKADKLLLATEARDLMPHHRADWTNMYEPLPFKIEPWSQEESEKMFMKRFFELTNSVNGYENWLKCDI